MSALLPLAVRLQPVTTLELDDSMLLSLDWGSDRILATGSSNGAWTPPVHGQLRLESIADTRATMAARQVASPYGMRKAPPSLATTTVG
jgi:hypothetical protein